MRSPSNVIAVVVLYHPVQADLLPKLDVLERSVDNLLLIDNTDKGSSWFAQWCNQANATNGQNVVNQQKRNTKLVYFQPQKNLGIAAAQNLAIRYAIDHYDDKDCIIFFDQDSDVPAELPKELAKRFINLSQNERVAAVGPLCVDKQKGFFYSPVTRNEKGVFKRLLLELEAQQQSVGALISSGMLTSIETIKAIGLYDEDLFIDYVDIDWCMKAQSKGYLLYVIPSVQMTHSIGEESIKVLGRNFSVHSPVRRYYMIRNSFFLARKAYVNPRQSVSFVYREVIKHMILMVLGKSQKKQCLALWKGVVDGLSNRVDDHDIIFKKLSTRTAKR